MHKQCCNRTSINIEQISLVIAPTAKLNKPIINIGKSDNVDVLVDSSSIGSVDMTGILVDSSSASSVGSINKVSI